MLSQFTLQNMAWVKTQEKQLNFVTNVSCLKIDPSNKYIFIGTKNGIVVVLNIHTFEQISEVMTLSSYAINNLEMFYEPTYNELCMLASLSSG